MSPKRVANMFISITYILMKCRHTPYLSEWCDIQMEKT